ncbi:MULTISPECIES: sulfur carrier protein ThiS [unclassified Janthinobacterium]|uniref:sulfur carrier protein ThiS n=1 Tax=unclassified Janthinobacterium TaxID=2610881 RepID=UPI0003490D0F|nr:MULTISPECIES: sulfur carrier protein ThiS [unclassified Janthinobacterium]MEC5160870.1 sulfur carrier protein [Janthinobacterium sp. CG_S6]
MVAILLNGAAREVPPQHTLHDLIEALELGGQALALAVNRAVVPRQRWREQVLRERDQVDIVRAIGGG